MVESSTLAKNQAKRRRRVMSAAMSLAADGGFENVQMRDVAAEADVALGTLYRYFPSKEYLLVSVLLELVDGLRVSLEQAPAVGDSPRDRVVDILRRAVSFHPDRDAFGALIRALASANPDIADLVREINHKMTTVIVGAMYADETEPTARDLQVARVLQLTWLSAVFGWINGVEDQSKVIEDLETAASLLMDPPPRSRSAAVSKAPRAKQSGAKTSGVRS
ncbi:MAG: TetR family transcriptional regulator [Acidimicrobiia bacterium]|nr:TetR family transcriptional regulator [Acidimicrobiia bacterium]